MNSECLNGFLPRGRFCNQNDILFALDNGRDPFTKKWMVIDCQNLDLVCHRIRFPLHLIDEAFFPVSTKTSSLVGPAGERIANKSRSKLLDARVYAPANPRIEGSDIFYPGGTLYLRKYICKTILSRFAGRQFATNLCIVQRLFSMFPSGLAGFAFLLLRFAITAMLLDDGTARWVLVTSPWILLGYVLIAASLCLGFMTPYCACISCLIQLGALYVTRGENGFHLAVSIMSSGIVAILGPGAYSIDANIYGRRQLKLPPRKLL